MDNTPRSLPVTHCLCGEKLDATHRNPDGPRHIEIRTCEAGHHLAFEMGDVFIVRWPSRAEVAAATEPGGAFIVVG